MASPRENSQLSRGLVRQPGNQIDIDVRNSGGAQARNVVEHGSSLVQTSHRRGFHIDERLHSQAHTIHSAAL